jgi:beta-lactamase superfamily II metal-dependent hydrolase
VFLKRLYSPILTWIILSLFVLPITSSAEEVVRLHFIHVGYGDSILIQQPDGVNILVDAGSREYSQQTIGYLKSLGIKYFDKVIISHPHENHFGGLSEILESFSVRQVFVNGDDKVEDGYEFLENQLNARNIPIKVLRRGEVLDSDNPAIKILILHPADTQQSMNDNSIVTLIQFKDRFFLLMADVGIKQQEEMIQLFPQIMEADVIQIPHHGGPLSKNFIQADQEQYFVVSTGPNRWGLPDEEALSRLAGKVYRTDKDGTIVFTSDGKNLTVNTINP